MTIVKVATTNPVKIKAIRAAFKRYYEDVEVITFKVNSGVPEQPIKSQVFKGAKNRLKALKNICGNYDYIVSCESGLINQYGYWFNVQVVMIERKDGKVGIGVSPGYEIPPKYVKAIINSSLKQVFDKIFDGKGGVRVLTKNQFRRQDLIENGTVMALIRVLNDEKW